MRTTLLLVWVLLSVSDFAHAQATVQNVYGRRFGFNIPFNKGDYRSAQGFMGKEYNPTLYHLGKDYCVKYAGQNPDGSLYGTPIYPIAAGKIVAHRYTIPAYRKDGVGNYVTLDHGNGVVALYMHLAKVYKTSGEISPDSPLGEAGDVILHPRPNCAHLHLEIRRRGLIALNVFPNLRYSYISIDGKNRIAPGCSFADETSVISWIHQNFYAPETVLVDKASSKPPIPYDDYGACPFEGCVYREWVAKKDISVLKERKNDSPILCTVRAGEKIQAIFGIVTTLEPGIARAAKRIRLAGLIGDPGEMIYLLTYQGEGTWRTFFHGTLVDGVPINESRYEAIKNDDPFIPEKKTNSIWWAKIETSQGNLGWTNEPWSFRNKDRFD